VKLFTMRLILSPRAERNLTAQQALILHLNYPPFLETFYA
jgi:hypothetical protein